MIDLNSLPLDVTSHLLKFRDFMVAAWPHLDALMEEHDWDDDIDFMDDWLQANWEFLVERELLGSEEYALVRLSYQTNNGRMTNSSRKPTHVILTQPVSEAPLIDLRTNRPLPLQAPKRLNGFETRTSDGGFGLYPPFDCAGLTIDAINEHYAVPVTDLRFILTAFSPESKIR